MDPLSKENISYQQVMIVYLLSLLTRTCVIYNYIGLMHSPHYRVTLFSSKSNQLVKTTIDVRIAFIANMLRNRIQQIEIHQERGTLRFGAYLSTGLMCARPPSKQRIALSWCQLRRRPHSLVLFAKCRDDALRVSQAGDDIATD